jgi:NO-binding membrane sensor protein with MHYT domain
MNAGMPNLLLMLFFPLICIGLGVAMDFAMALARRRKLDQFPGGTNRFYWAVLIAAVIRSAVFSLMFVPALALEGQVMAAYEATRIEASLLMVLPALFGAYFATQLERHVFELLESTLLRDRAAFLAAPRTRRPKVGA